MAKNLLQIKLHQNSKGTLVTVFGTHSALIGAHELVSGGSDDPAWAIPKDSPGSRIRVHRDAQGDLSIFLDE